MKKQPKLRPESLMMSYGYKAERSEGSIKLPLFQTSTFAFKNAEEGKAFFEVAYGLRDKGANEVTGLIYSRINNPEMEVLENRLSLWDEAEDCAVFESGMSAISTVFLEFLRPGDLLFYSTPLYGGTDSFLHDFLTKLGVTVLPFKPGLSQQEMEQVLLDSGKANQLAMIYAETPANPTNALIDLEICSRICANYSQGNKKVLLAVDNTYMGPLWQHPLRHGADLSLYSATKYIGGHSDLIAGACCGSSDLIKRVKKLRTSLGNMCSPHTAWLLLRSLETLKIRMEQQARNAKVVAEFLDQHPNVDKVYYLGFIEPGTLEYEIYKRQYSAAGAMLSFDIKGGEEQAYRFLNSLKLIKLAVSLGSTESLAQHPDTMTHIGVDAVEKREMSITGKLIRLSVGVEYDQDLIWDLEQALENR